MLGRCRGRLHFVILCRVARNTTHLAVADDGLATLGPGDDVIGRPVVPLAFLPGALQLDLACATIPPINGEALLVTEEPLVVL